MIDNDRKRFNRIEQRIEVADCCMMHKTVLKFLLQIARSIIHRDVAGKIWKEAIIVN